jgi:hypothetical protein
LDFVGKVGGEDRWEFPFAVCGWERRVCGRAQKDIHCGVQILGRGGFENFVLKVFALRSGDHVADFGSCSVKDLLVNVEPGRARTTLGLPSFTFGISNLGGEPGGGGSIGHGADGDRCMGVKEVSERGVKV